MTHDSRRVAVGLGAIAVATFIAVTSEFLPIGVLPQIVKGLDVPTSVAGLAVSVFAAIVAVLAIPLTAVTERVPRKVLLVVALLGYAASNAIVAVAPTFAVLCVGRAIGGLSHAVFYSVVTAYASALVPPHRVGRAMSVAFTGASLGTVVGVPVTTLIGDRAGWRVAFAVVAIAAVLLVIAVLVLIPGVAPRPHEEGAARYRRGRGLVGVVVADVLVFIGHFAAHTYIAPLLARADIRGPSLSAALLLLGALGFGGVLLAGIFGDRHLRLTYAGSAGLIAVALVALTVFGQATAPALVSTGVWSLAFGAVSPLVATAAVRTRAVSDSMAGAVVNTAGNIGIALGSITGGAVIALGALNLLPLVGAVIAAAGTAVTIAARRAYAPVSG